MKFTAKQISELVNGLIEGDPDVTIHKVSKIEQGEPGSISFLSNPLYTQYIYKTEASIVIVNKSFVPEHPVKATLVRVNSAEVAFAKLLELYNQIKDNKKGISRQCFIAESAKLGENPYVGEFAYIGENTQIGNNVKIHPQVYIGDNTQIGDNTILYPGVKIYSDIVIGKNCIFHAGVVIGSDGFRFAPQNEGNKKIPQIGNVVIEDDVEMGANCAIDRATLGSTIIRKGVKFDNLVHIAHNCEIGENTYIAAATGIAGSTKLGKNCLISGHVSMAPHLTIADNTSMGGATGVSKSLTKPGLSYLGAPAMEVSKFRRSIVHFRNLPEIVERIEKLEKEHKQK
ncbi:MAG: UDP-3-O-(3-hydroxymyristoyl)glucosamine N-acyltransferase [Bacteroidales bacterium]|jgi:UDP-3-O-[3-hydroxymyristoyl] glucosamine N-acyltransferase|nr:UDP-3-O-(3-hydroxymyristoyl)glucosamine N-acyltransferase [Bacteroidales bacterium]